MPVYQAESYVAEAIESMLHQTFVDFEFLVFDDGSTDGSAEVIRPYAERDERIRFFQKPHAGYTRWLNEGASLARGEFIARMDADDVSLPTRLADQVEYMRTHPDCVVVGCGVMLVDPEGAPVSRQTLPLDHETIESQLLDGVPGQICHPAALIRREALSRIGGYRTDRETVEDYDLLLRLAEVGKLANLPQVLLHYRLHHASVCFRRRDEQVHLSQLILSEARSRRGLAPMEFDVQVLHLSANAHSDWLWARWAAAGGQRRTALKHAWRGVRRDPIAVRSWLVMCRCLAPEAGVRLARRYFPYLRRYV